MAHLIYQGDQSSSYDHGTGTGLVGKVMGPDARGIYMVVTDAVYDAETDTTVATFRRMPHPEDVLAMNLEGPA